MTTLHDIAPSGDFDEALAARLVSCRKSPLGDLLIWNYTQRAVYSHQWNPVTLACRGLITTPGGKVVARPFAKFFNLDALAEVPPGPAIVNEKVDGSLGIIYLAGDDRPAVATRGSFDSEQAAWATAWLRAHPDEMQSAEMAIDMGRTLLVEIVYPQNRIVVDYGDRAELVYLGCIDIETGDDVVAPWAWPGAVATFETIDGLHELPDLLAACDQEGFVLRWRCGTRAKVKTAEYLRLHKLLTGVNERRVWEVLASGGDLSEMLDVVPDEFHRWVSSVADGLRARFAEIESSAKATLRDVPGSWSRAQQAEVVKLTPFPAVLFAMLDRKDHAPLIWKLIRPEAGAPFCEVAE